MSTVATPARPRHFLFLQGPTNFLFAAVAQRLRDRGHAVQRINFCVGDQLFWRGPDAVNFRGRLEQWPAFIAAFLQEHAVTDIVLLGEQRVYHRAAIAAARPLGIAVTVTDFGYIRPDWVIVERNGMNAESEFPRDPAAILALAHGLPPVDRELRYTDRFLNQALWDMTFHLSSALWPWPFPHFRRHTLHHPLLTYCAIGWRLARGAWERRRAARIIEAIDAKQPLFVFAMQTEDDYSLRAYSLFPDLDTPMRQVIQSFARAASPEAVLVFKVHPLDPGIKAWGRRIARMATEAGVAARVRFIDGGDLDALIRRARGVITVNSTVGLRSIELGCPTLALGEAIYRVAGLTFEAPLDEFFSAPVPPDAALADAFLRAIAATLHVRGGYYAAAGLDAAAEGMAYRLHHELVNQPVTEVLLGKPMPAA